MIVEGKDVEYLLKETLLGYNFRLYTSVIAPQGNLTKDPKASIGSKEAHSIDSPYQISNRKPRKSATSVHCGSYPTPSFTRTARKLWEFMATCVL
ncbi:hypothetical protein G7Y89_g14535 [Cudoniella acicularis]|uniref:Uncharacterized protein n=1 Tax=Cudoniella acicularis TaxID=354080 RepID=A0A8H4VVJ8_9HELO|nr:hypothetical protein G7Y89_g14535 [Cudoniella acicularis]